MKSIRYVYSNGEEFWKKGVTGKESYEDTLEVTSERKQAVKGFGGCFNEAGWEVLKKLKDDERKSILDDLFNEDGCAFNMGRLPMGANDYALEWYSYDETPGDYELNNFSIERDKEYLLPYVKEAIKRRPEIALFASPWSPPTWMKTKRAYNFGKLIWEDENLKAYANYFIK